MAYTKTVWQDRSVATPMTFTVPSPIVAGTPFTLSPSEGTVAQAGTPLSAANLNKLETQYDEVAALAQMYKLTADNGNLKVCPNGTDLNAITATGFYFVETAGSNMPTYINTSGVLTNVTNWLHLEVLNYNNGTRIVQRATKDNSGGGTVQMWIRVYNGGSWSTWREIVIAQDTPTWTNLALINGVTPYATGLGPKFTKIGGVVYISGAAKGLTVASLQIATLPAGFRPMETTAFALPTTNVSGANFARWSISATGSIIMDSISAGGSTATSAWYPTTMSFVAMN